MIKIGLVDDHLLLRKSISLLLQNEKEFKVMLEAYNGKDLISKINKKNLPDIILLDINMPEMDGYETAKWLKENFPTIKVLILTMYNDEVSIVRMLNLGACGYLQKDVSPEELIQAIDTVFKKGYYYSENMIDVIHHQFNKNLAGSSKENINMLTAREIELLNFLCTELTYKEIAEKMHLSPRTVDGFRDGLFNKLNVKTRVGLVMYAIKNNIISLQ